VLRKMGYRKLSARPRHHAQAEGAIEDFKKVFPSAWKRSAARRARSRRHRGLVRRRGAHRPEEQDHPPLGQARNASERSQRSANRLCLYIRRNLPQDGKGAALVLPRCDTEAMNLHLAEIATQIAPGAHAALIVDQAGWHLSGRLIVPPNIRLIGKMPGAEPAGKRLAVHARQLALEPNLQILRRHRRPLLRRLEQAHRSALAHHVHRTARMGLSV
jgi:putative transposase